MEPTMETLMAELEKLRHEFDDPSGSHDPEGLGERLTLLLEQFEALARREGINPFPPISVTGNW